MEKKFLIIIQAGEQDMGRAYHGLSYGEELHEAGYEVKIYFDGQGTKWIKEFEKTDHLFHPLYKQVQKLGIIKGACRYCAGFFDLQNDVQEAGIPLDSSGKDGHLNLDTHIKEGFTPIVL